MCHVQVEFLALDSETLLEIYEKMWSSFVKALYVFLGSRDGRCGRRSVDEIMEVQAWETEDEWKG